MMMNQFGEKKKDDIRKGPWKSEEDEVLLNHVKKCGPRDWSSLRSKGLLSRTGKSCRLRWVNKLRPNLKNGCKFSLEEERIVIELQAQFGNKWARIATYLQGRTDNDVKNFWSSRQKRLARILQSPISLQQSKPQKPNKESPVFHHFPYLEAHKVDSTLIESSSSSSSPHIDNSESTIKMAPFPDLTTKNIIYPLDYTFPHIPPPLPELPLSPECQELVARLEDPNFMDVFGPRDYDYGISHELPCFELDVIKIGADEKGNHPMAPESYLDDFPPDDMFYQFEPIPSLSEW